MVVYKPGHKGTVVRSKVSFNLACVGLEVAHDGWPEVPRGDHVESCHNDNTQCSRADILNGLRLLTCEAVRGMLTLSLSSHDSSTG